MEEEPNKLPPPKDHPPEEPSGRGRRDSIRQYLMGELSEDGQEQVERRLLSEDDYFEELLIAEEELADDFVGERLDDAESAKFSQRFLSVPELRQEVMFAKALRRRAAEYARDVAPRQQAERAPPLLATLIAFLRRPAVGFSMAAALLLAVCATLWLAAQNRSLREQVEQLRARTTATPAPTPQPGLLEQLASERERSEELAARLRSEQEQRAEAERKLEEARVRRPQPQPGQAQGSASVVAFTLSPGLVRGPGEGMKKISVPPGGGRVLLLLDLAVDDYTTYRAMLKTLEGAELLSAANLRARGVSGRRTVAFNVPAAKLAPGHDYEILLGGKSASGEYEDVGTYNFRVVR